MLPAKSYNRDTQKFVAFKRLNNIIFASLFGGWMDCAGLQDTAWHCVPCHAMPFAIWWHMPLIRINALATPRLLCSRRRRCRPLLWSGVSGEDLFMPLCRGTSSHICSLCLPADKWGPEWRRRSSSDPRRLLE